MTSLAGVWRDTEGAVTMFIDGQEPSYRFRSQMTFDENLTAEGFIHRLPDGNYQATGQGVGGRTKFRVWIWQENILRVQNQVLIDGGMIDDLLGAFVPHPIMTFLREHAPGQ